MQTTKIDLGNTLNNAFEIFKKTFLISGLALSFLVTILMCLVFIGMEYFVGMEKAAVYLKTFDPATLSWNGTLLYLVVILVVTLLIAPFSAGILKMMQDADTQKEISLSSLFYYINSPYYFSILGATLLLTLCNFAITTSIQHIVPSKMIESVISSGLSIFLSIATLLTIPNIIFKDYSVIAAIKASLKITMPNFFTILLLLVIAIFIGYLGILAFCIGLFFTFPIYFAMQYSIFKNSTI